MSKSERLRTRRERRRPSFTLGDGVRIGAGVVLVGLAFVGLLFLLSVVLGAAVLSVA